MSTLRLHNSTVLRLQRRSSLIPYFSEPSHFLTCLGAAVHRGQEWVEIACDPLPRLGKQSCLIGPAYLAAPDDSLYLTRSDPIVVFGNHSEIDCTRADVDLSP